VVSGSIANSAATVNGGAMLTGTGTLGATAINAGTFSRRARPPSGHHHGCGQAGTDRGGVLSECTAQILRLDPVEQGADCGQMVERMDALFANEREINAKPRTTASSGKPDCRSPSRKLASKTLRPKLLDPAHFSETRVGFTRSGCHHSLVRS
jgi:hypothetical protein